jgi:hypothetical protein
MGRRITGSDVEMFQLFSLRLDSQGRKDTLLKILQNLMHSIRGSNDEKGSK